MHPKGGSKSFPIGQTQFVRLYDTARTLNLGNLALKSLSERGFRDTALGLKARLDALSGDINAFEQAIEIHNGFLAAPLRVVVKHEAALIGDSLNTVAWMLAFAARDNRKVHVGGQFASAVKPLVSGMPISFDPIDGPGPNIEFVADVRACWDFAGPRGLHMLQGYFALAGMSPPMVPIALPLATEICDLPPGVVISPFCGSESQEPEQHVRVWYLDRWKALIEFLLSTGRTSCIYVLAGPNDDPTPFLRDGVVAVQGYPLTQVLDLMKRSDLCVSIDTGTSHLAHYGSVDKHLVLYPEVNFPTIHTNPRARMLRAWPADISVELVISEAATILAQRG